MSSKREDTNRYLAENDALFKRACDLAKVPPTRRQYSRWRNQRGRAFAKRREALANPNANEQSVTA